MKFFSKNKAFLGAGIFLFLLFSIPCSSVASLGETVNFNVDKSFDSAGRSQISAVLVKSSSNIYFYIEKLWWDNQKQATRDSVLEDLNSLTSEFDNNIYRKLTSVLGSEWKPGIDGDNKITILFETMQSNEGGYFREEDEYEKLQIPTSNAREMIYLSLDKIQDPQLKVILAHEFTHLITFNQKNKILGVEEAVWLNEARAEYSAEILGYNEVYEDSVLQRRVKDFASSPADSITNWKGTKYDYASVSLFVNYLVDHYGVNILSYSLKSNLVGKESINYALQRNGVQDDFTKIFQNWTIAVVLGDCSNNTKYCYLNKNLKSLKISPSLNFLPVSGNVSLSVSNFTKNWQGNWFKFIGGDGDLKLDFSNSENLDFNVPYITEDSSGKKIIKFLQLNSQGSGSINISRFSADYKSIIVIPSLEINGSALEESEKNYPFTYTVSVSSPAVDQDVIQKLLSQIADLKAQIAKLLQNNSSGGNSISCSSFNNNLYVGLVNNESVRCLQTFLKNQGTDIYPSGLVTGNFGNLTRQAVIKFQEKYASDILTPFGLVSGTGYVGEKTRQKINQMING